MPINLQNFIIYLFYGMAFFAMGVSIMSRDTRTSNLGIAPFLWYFAVFAYIHAFHEWSDLYLLLFPDAIPKGSGILFEACKIAMVFISFGFLLLFGLRVLRIVNPARRHLFSLLPVVLLTLLTLSLFSHGKPFSPEWFENADYRIRNIIGFSGAALSGVGLIFYSRTVRDLSDKGARNFFGAGIFLTVYGLLTGIVPSQTIILPSHGVPVELFRGLTAFIVLHFIMNALHTFDVERKLLIEERLNRFAKSEKLNSLGKLSFGIAHEINNPLANVSLNVELLKKGLISRDSFRFYEKRIAYIERNLERASKIARELLHFGSSKDFEFTKTDINEVINSTLELVGDSRKEYRINHEPGPLAPIMALPWKLEEVFLNVINNAMEAMPAGGEITIETGEDKDNIRVHVIDNGPGISTRDLDYALDPFFTTKPPGKGTGLGLSICYGIMELHGGSIELASKPGSGTTVSLTFPLEGATQ